jgi:hypothetical protein
VHRRSPPARVATTNEATRGRKEGAGRK